MAQKMQKAIMEELDNETLETLERLEQLLAEDAPAGRKTIQDILDEPTFEKVEKSLQQAKERAEALRFLCMHLIKYLKENNFHADFIKFFNEILEKTDSFLGGEQMFMDLSEENLNNLCDLLANELLCFNN